jgi:diguanylate cyclase (GGDEF)-like protein
MEDESQGELAPLIQSAEYARMVDRFQASTGLRLQVFTGQAEPLTPVEEYPRYCRLLQERKVCPLYFDPQWLLRDREEMAVCAAGVGHFAAPIRDEKQEQIGAVLGPAVKFAENKVEPLAELAFKLKVFPDDLIQAADAVQAVDADRILGAGELVAVGLNLLTELQAKERVVTALKRLQTQIAESNAELLGQQLVDAVVYLSRADYALALLMDDSGQDLASAYEQSRPDQLADARRKLTEGVAEWVRHADQSVQVPDISKSAWSRYLTNDAVQAGSVIGVPIPGGEGRPPYGAIVVAWNRPRDDLDEPMSSLNEFVSQGLYAIVIGRKLIQAEQGALLDTASGAYTARYLDELLDREISRAARFTHNLSLVLFEIDGYEALRTRAGEAGLRRILREFVAMLRQRTRKLNTLARVQEGRFCLVIPEGTREVAFTLGQRLQRDLEEHPFILGPNGEIVRLTINLGVAATPAGKDDKATLMRTAVQGLDQARTERRIESFKKQPGA